MSSSSRSCRRLLRPWRHFAFFVAHMLLASLWSNIVEALAAPKPLEVGTWSSRNPRVCASEVSLWASATDGATEEPPKDESIEGPKETLTWKYRRHSQLSAILSVFLLCMPDRTKPTTMATKAGGAAGYGVAAGVSDILASATEKGLLSSDTYKRLNVGLLLFSTLSVLAIPGEASFFPNFGGALCTALVMLVVRVFGISAAYEGWVRGLLPDTDDNESSSLSRGTVLKEFLNGTTETVRDSFEGTKKSVKYRVLLLLIVFGLGNNIMSLHHSVTSQASPFQTSLCISGLARLTLLSTIVYTLKSAAERDRLSGSTFVRLNFLMAGWAVLVGIGDGMTRVGFSLRRAVTMLFVALPFASIGVQSLQAKSKK